MCAGYGPNQTRRAWEAKIVGAGAKEVGRPGKLNRPLFMKETGFHKLHLPRDICSIFHLP